MMPRRPQRASFHLNARDPSQPGSGSTALICDVEWDVERKLFRASDSSPVPDQFDAVAAVAALKLFTARLALELQPGSGGTT